MKTIWKYELEGSCSIKMPTGAEVLSVQVQRDVICLWALVDPEAEGEARRFLIHGTGHSVPDVPLRFLGTTMFGQGALVFHVFELLTDGSSNRSTAALSVRANQCPLLKPQAPCLALDSEQQDAHQVAALAKPGEA